MFSFKALYLLPNILAAAGMAAIAINSWVRRNIQGSWVLMLATAGAALWAFCETMLLFDVSLQSKIYITYAQYIGIVCVPPTAFLITQIYIGSTNWQKKTVVLPLFVIPLFSLFFAFTNPWHHHFFTRFWIDTSGPFPMLAVSHGIFFWFFVAYSYTLLSVAIIALIRYRVNAPSIYRRQVSILIFATLFPWITNAIHIFKLSPIPELDLTPVTFCIIAAGFTLKFFRNNFLDIMPVAKDVVFQNLRDPIIVLDPKLRLIDRNQAGLKLLGTIGVRLTGKDAMEVLQPVFGDGAFMLASHADQAELTTRSPDNPKTYDVRVSIIRDRSDKPLGRVIVFRDITERKRLESELRRLANTDPLTGSHNRRSFQTKSEQEIVRSRRYGRPLSVLLFDLDRFKLVNDTFGHEAGDTVLKEFAGLALDMCRKSDIFGRLGGEEFALLLPETPLDMGIMVANRLREKLKKTVFRFEARPTQCTVSIGVVALESPEDTLKSLLAKADAALYAAKSAGRDRVVG